MNIFFDTEFTGLHQRTTLISIGMVSEDGRTFYAEFTDYNPRQVNDWIEENVLKNLTLSVLDEHQKSYIITDGDNTRARGDSQFIAGAITSWLMQWDQILVFWGNCPAYDWVLFCELFGGAQHIPDGVWYIPADLSTYLLAKKIVIDETTYDDMVSHNALDDARAAYRIWKELA